MFINDIEIKDLNIYYNKEKTHKDIQQYILKIIQNLNKIFINIECAEECISEKKLQFIMKYIKIINYIYKLNNRSSVASKVLKILN